MPIISTLMSKKYTLFLATWIFLFWNSLINLYFGLMHFICVCWWAERGYFLLFKSAWRITDGKVGEGSQWSIKMGSRIPRAASALLGVYATVASLNKKNKKTFHMALSEHCSHRTSVRKKKSTAARLCSKTPGLINTVEQEQERIYHHQIVNHSKGWWYTSTSDLVSLYTAEWIREYL